MKVNMILAIVTLVLVVAVAVFVMFDDSYILNTDGTKVPVKRAFFGNHATPAAKTT